MTWHDLTWPKEIDGDLERDMKWSVNVAAEGDRAMTREEIVELADAVAGLGGIASGIGAHGYGAQIVVEALDRESAVRVAGAEFIAAAARAGLPAWPIAGVDAVSEDEDLDDFGAFGEPA